MTTTMPPWVVEPPLFDEPSSAPAERDVSRPTAVAHDASLAAATGDASRLEPGRMCLWCGGPIRAAARRDALCCSKRCRQARHRFTRAIGRPGDVAAIAATAAARLAYADPPYPGKAWRYRGHRDYAGEVDHGELIRRLSTYDGWALSTSAAALPELLGLCPAGVRVAAWVRGERATRAYGPLNGWEPVIYSPARAPLREPAGRVVDVLTCGVGPRLTDPNRVVGAKPAAFASWMFDLLGAQPGDGLDDLFPGSGGIGRAWAIYTGAVAPVDARDASCSAGAGVGGGEQDRAFEVERGHAAADVDGFDGEGGDAGRGGAEQPDEAEPVELLDAGAGRGHVG